MECLVAFFLSTNGILHSYQFDYFQDVVPSSRLEKTKIHSDSVNPTPHSSKIYFEQIDLYAIDIMSKSIITMLKSTHLDKIQKVMQQKNIRHIPIVKENKLLGMISDRDLLKLDLSAAFSFLKAEEIMTTVIIVTEEETPLSQIARVLVEENISALPVINKKHELVGIISRTDILKIVVGHRLVVR